MIPTLEIPLRIAGFVPLSTVDWPDQLAAVIFTQGCPWRCGYCHNSHLIAPRSEISIEWETVLTEITKRKKFLDGVVISGGEPLLQRGIIDVLQHIRALGLKTGLHTSGSLPKQLKTALPLLNWVGLDIKATPEHYAQITHRRSSGKAAWQSLDLLIESGIDCEVRITVHADLMKAAALDELLNLLASKNVQKVRLQKARGPFLDDTLSSNLLDESYQYCVNQQAQRFESLQWR
jgi:pyruvate formate lyase activating enzyme